MAIICTSSEFRISDQRLASIEADMDRLGIRDRYDELIALGNSPTMAQMLASRKCAASKGTDSDFCRRERERMGSMSDEQLAGIVEVAKRAGIDTHGKTYNGQLGKYNEADAWVTGTGDVRRTAIKKGLTVRGAVNVDGPSDVPLKKRAIAPDILNRLEKTSRAADPSLDAKCRKSKTARLDLRQQLTQKHARKPR